MERRADTSSAGAETLRLARNIIGASHHEFAARMCFEADASTLAAMEDGELETEPPVVVAALRALAAELDQLERYVAQRRETSRLDTMPLAADGTHG